MKLHLLLTGAPDPHALNWDESGLLASFQDTIVRFARLDQGNRAQQLSGEAQPRSSLDPRAHVVWRSIPLFKKRIPTGFTQSWTPNPNFFTTALAGSFRPGLLTNSSMPPSASFGTVTPAGGWAFEDEDMHDCGRDSAATPGFLPRQILSQFYEHSLAVHKDTPSSQLISSSEGSYLCSVDDESFLTQDSDSLLSDASTSFLQQREVARHAPPPGPLPLVNVKNIPPAAQLTRLQPQTVTVNLVVGIISVAAPRAVRTRWGSCNLLVEVLVGDETGAGFAVTFWLSEAGGGHDKQRQQLEGLRLQDVVLLRNVALHVFMGKVYGSSLRKDGTKIDLLFRRRVRGSRGRLSRDEAGWYRPVDMMASSIPPIGVADAQLDKARRVWDWVLRFVDAGSRDGIEDEGLDGGRRAAWDEPPPHSQ